MSNGNAMITLDYHERDTSERHTCACGRSCGEGELGGRDGFQFVGNGEVRCVSCREREEEEAGDE
jgi:hypothetical protein